MPSLYLDHLLLYINTYSTCRQISIWSASTNKVVVSLLRESLSLPRLESRDSMRWPGTHIDHPSTQQHYIYTESLGVHSSQSTTGISSFAECQVHSAKPQKHPAKALPSVALGEAHSANKSSAKTSLPSVFYRTLGENFAECYI